MAWQFFGTIEPGTATRGTPNVPLREVGKPLYGPFPRKRWVAVKGERYRLQYKTPKVRCYAPSADAQAEAYARWLAARDGVAIPADAVAHICMSSVPVPYRKTPEPRPFKVQFFAAVADRYGETKLGAELAAIDLPNWDFVAAPAVEEVQDAAGNWVALDRQLAAAMLPPLDTVAA